MRYVNSCTALALSLLSTAVGFGQQQRLVSIDIVFADISGTSSAVEMTADRILELEKQGKLDAVARLRLATIELQKGVAHFGERLPVVASRAFRGGAAEGFGGQAISMDNYGTQVGATPRIEQDGTIVIDLQAERTRLIAARPSGEEGGAPSIAATRTAQVTSRTTVRVASGKPVIVSGQQAISGNNAVHTYIVLTASVPEGAKAAIAPDTELKVFALKNAKAEEVAVVLTSVLEQPFRLGVDQQGNRLIVHGPPAVLQRVGSLLTDLDGR
jgi:type II secretory pathway component GspD/PulD (secretin)